MQYCLVILKAMCPMLILIFQTRCDERSREITFHDIAPLDYDYLRSPSINGSAVRVEINIQALNVRSVDEADMSFTVSVEVWQGWDDLRLIYPAWAKDSAYQILDSSWISKLWHPKLFFPNAVEGRINSIITPSSFFWMSRDRRVYYCSRVVLRLICEMNLLHFPHDKQRCGMKMASAIYTDRQLVIDWMNSTSTVKKEYSSLKQFDIVQLEKHRCHQEMGPHNVSCVEGSLVLRRRCGYHIINVYIPTVLIVTISQLTFWIPADSVPARVTLGVTSLLTIITKQSPMPSVSYVVALDFWLSVCTAVVFLSLLEYAVVIALRKTTRENECMVILKANGTWTATQDPSNAQDKKEHFQCNKLDYYSRIIFPVFFIIFCISYWGYYS